MPQRTLVPRTAIFFSLNETTGSNVVLQQLVSEIPQIDRRQKNTAFFHMSVGRNAFREIWGYVGNIPKQDKDKNKDQSL